MLLEKRPNIVGRQLFGHIPEWAIALFVLGAAFVIVFILFVALFEKLPKAKDDRISTEIDENDHQRGQPETPSPIILGQRLRGSFALTFWLFLIFSSFLIYVDSVYSGDYGFTRKLFYLACPLMICVATFVLEGLEIAYTDLRDKDPQQFQKSPAFDTYHEVSSKIGETNFYEAREWAIIALLVGGTLLIEQPDYHVPFVGVINKTHTEAWIFLRILLTTSLTAFALVWVAQSPAKFVARRNSIEFLVYCSRVPVFLIRFALLLFNGLGLNRPSELINEFVLNVAMKKCKKERRLLPSDRTFFADSLKKYGYGYLISDDIVKVDPEGGFAIATKVLYYIGSQRSTIKRQFSYESDFSEDTLRDLASAHPARSKCWAYLVPLIGEKADQQSLATWEALFYSQEPDTWKPKIRVGYESKFERLSTRKFSLNLTHTPVKTDPDNIQTGVPSDPSQPLSHESSHVPGPEPALNKLDVELCFEDVLPYKNDLGEIDRALLVLWQLEVDTNPGTMQLAPSWSNVPTRYPYFKRHSHPCLVCSVAITLPSNESGDWIFINAAKPENYNVTYDGVRHLPETDRLARQNRTLPLRLAPIRPDYRDLMQTIVLYLDSPLPSARYESTVWIKKEPPKPAGDAEENVVSGLQDQLPHEDTAAAQTSAAPAQRAAIKY